MAHATTKRRIQMTQRAFLASPLLRFATVSAWLLLTLAPRFFPLLEAQSIATTSLTVHVTGARNTKGKIRAALYQDSKGFPNDPARAVLTQAADIDPQTMSAQITFTGLRDGVYAMSVFHDENMNQKLDKNFVGIPKEGYGVSNNPRKKMGPPTFEEARFQLSGAPQSVEIKLIY
jgi:uncharacterized protein (DUF2141 family)